MEMFVLLPPARAGAGACGLPAKIIEGMAGVATSSPVSPAPFLPFFPLSVVNGIRDHQGYVSGGTMLGCLFAGSPTLLIVIFGKKICE